MTGDADTQAIRHQLQQERSKPVIERILQWATVQVGLPRSDFGKAVRYMLERWAGLTRFLDDPRVPGGALLKTPVGTYDTRVKFSQPGLPPRRGMRLPDPIADEGAARERYAELVESAIAKGWIRRPGYKKAVNEFDQIPEPPLEPSDAGQIEPETIG